MLRALEAKPELRYQTAGEMRTEVETLAHGAPKAEAGRVIPMPAVVSRFSRAAIWGATWVPLFFTLALVFFGKKVVSGEDHGPAWWQTLLTFTLLPLGVAAPFGTTILGWISVTQIRRSAGKLYGLGLAVFDGLLFPLLMLDALVIGLPIAAWKYGYDPALGFSGAKLLLLLTMVTN